MTSFGYRSNPLYAIKECSSYGTLYTRDCGCSKRNVEDKILVPKPNKNCARYTRCDYLVDGPNCQGCALLRQELEENLVTHSLYFQNTSEPSNASTNVVNAPRDPYVVKQDNGSFKPFPFSSSRLTPELQFDFPYSASLGHDPGSLGDKIICDLDKTPDLSQRSPHNCPKCGNPVDGHYFQGCALLRKKLKEDMFTYCIENGILQDSSKPSNDNTNVVNAPQEPFVVEQDPDENSLQSPPQINHHCCYECGDSLEDIFFHQCTCELCGKAESPFTLDSTPTYVNESPNVFNPPPQPPVYPCEFCRNDAYFSHYCIPQAPFIYPEPCYNQHFNFLQNFQNVPQQYPCCDDCGVTHDAYQCQPMTEVYDYGQNSCYDSNSIGFAQSQPQQYTVNHPIFNAHHDLLGSQKKLNITLTKVTEQMTQLTSMCEMACQLVQKKQEEKQIEEEQADKAQTWKLPVCYDDDDDEESSNSLEDNIISELLSYSAVTPTEPVDFLNMGDEHLNTIPTTESDEFIKSCVENLVPNQSESEGENECDVPAGFTTFSNVLFDIDYDFDSGDDQSLSDEDVPEKIYSNPLFDEEIIPMEIDQHSFNAESDLIDSMPNHDSSITISSKIYSLFDEFTGELTLLKSIPPGIDETDCHPEKEIRLTNRLLYDNSSPRPPKEIVSDNCNADIESFSSSPIPNLDSDPLIEEIDLSFDPDDPLPPGIEDDDYDSGRDIPILEKVLDNYSIVTMILLRLMTILSLLTTSKYEAFYNDHVKEISSGSTTTHSDSSLYDPFIFDLLINPFPPADRSDFYEFTDELAYIISAPKYDYLCFKIEPNSGDFTMDVVEDIFLTIEPRVHDHNVLPTHPTCQLNMDFILYSESLFSYVVWIFLPFLSYSVAT
nr:hypothetical protein [Tanacetum cinerariifolium]